MKINQIQSQLAFNRKELAKLNKLVKYAKGLRKYWNGYKIDVYADEWHGVVVQESKRIAKLVMLQKALKKDLARELSYERAARQMDLIKASCMANVGEVF